MNFIDSWRMHHVGGKHIDQRVNGFVPSLSLLEVFMMLTYYQSSFPAICRNPCGKPLLMTMNHGYKRNRLDWGTTLPCWSNLPAHGFGVKWPLQPVPLTLLQPSSMTTMTLASKYWTDAAIPGGLSLQLRMQWDPVPRAMVWANPSKEQSLRGWGMCPFKHFKSRGKSWPFAKFVNGTLGMNRSRKWHIDSLGAHVKQNIAWKISLHISFRLASCRVSQHLWTSDLTCLQDVPHFYQYVILP